MNEAVYIMMNTNMLIPITLAYAIPATPNMPMAIPMEPTTSNGFRPHLSTVMMAMTVKITFTIPMMMVCIIDASFPAPKLS